MLFRSGGPALQAARQASRALALLPRILDAAHGALVAPPPRRQAEFVAALAARVRRTLGESGVSCSEAEAREGLLLLAQSPQLARDWCAVSVLAPSVQAPAAPEREREVFRLSSEAWAGKITIASVRARVAAYVRARAE